jgi:hypothetical protein
MNDTQARADAIKDVLVAKGVDAARIEAAGMGGGNRASTSDRRDGGAKPPPASPKSEAPKSGAPAAQ